MNKYTKVHKNPQGEQVYKIEKKGKPDKHIVMVDLVQEYEFAEARLQELAADLEAVGKLAK